MSAHFHAGRETGAIVRDVQKGTDGIGLLHGVALFTIVPTTLAHLLKTFISPDQNSTHTIMWQVIVHVALLVSALMMALVDRLTTHTHARYFEESTALPSR
jgi:uncharacterized protein (TIGR00645 family)